MKLLPALKLASPGVISIVGAGGKTSLAFALAGEFAEQGFRVLVTTTTAMFHPDQVLSCDGASYGFDQFFLGPARDLPRIEPGEILLAARDQKGLKIKGYAPEELSRALPLYDAVIVEADGARMKPLKAPAAHEPVLLPETRTLIACLGLDCLGRPLDHARVHRIERVMDITGLNLSDPVSPESLMRLAAHPQGCFKGAGRGMDRVLVFNKADSKAMVGQGRALAKTVKPLVPGLTACLVTCLKDAKDPVKAGWYS